jgi:hypothetical protein
MQIVSAVRDTIDRHIVRFEPTERNYSKIEWNCAGIYESSAEIRPSCVGIYGAAPVRRKLLEAEPKSGRACAKFGRAAERSARIIGNSGAILIGTAGTGLHTEDLATRAIVTAGGIATAGIATENEVGTHLTPSILFSGRRQPSRLLSFPLAS